MVKVSLSLLFFLSILLLPQSYAQANFFEIYPNIPRVDYNGVYFFNPDSGFIVGNSGTINRTTNGGMNWELKKTNTDINLHKIKAFSKNNIIVCGQKGTLLQSFDFGESWNLIQLDTNKSLVSISVINNKIAWISGLNSALYKSEDGGKLWVSINTGYNGNYRDIAFYGDSIGYISNSGGLLVTEDGGTNWNNKGFSGGYPILPLNNDFALMGSPTGHIFYSRDRGTTWQTNVTIPFASNIQSITMLNDSVGFASANDASGYYKTTDGGINWQFGGIEIIGNRQIIFVNDSIGYGVGTKLTLTKTTNGGEQWNRLIINEYMAFIEFINENKGFIGINNFFSFEGTALYYSTDGGFNWNLDNKFPGYNETSVLRSIYFIDSITGFIGSGSSKILKTVNGGSTWELKDTARVLIGNSSLPIEEFFAVGKYIFAVAKGTTGSRIKKSSDYGETWSLTDFNFSSSLNNIFFIDSLNGWVAGKSYFAKTNDGGLTWDKDTILNYTEYFDVYFSDSSSGFITVDSNKVLKTSDGGTTWELSDIKGRIITITLDRKYLYLSSSHGLYYSTNRGEDWELRFTAAQIVTAPVLNHGWSYNFNQQIWKYEDNLITSFHETKNINLDNSGTLSIYPSPANNQTTILFKVHNAGIVRLDLYNILGEKLEELFNEYKQPGEYKINYNTSQLASGVYFLRLIFVLDDNKEFISKKFLILK